MFGYTAAEMIGRPISTIIPPERKNEDLAVLHRIKTTKAQEHYETVRVHKDGRRLDVAITVAPLCDAAGAVVGVSKIAHDITEKKKAAVHQHLLYKLVASVNRADAIEDENELLGKFMVYFDVPQPHRAETLRVAETVARQVGIAIARRRAADTLEALVESRTASLQEAIQQMEEFSYSVSHDLRAPIRAMIGYSDILLGDHGEKLDDDVREFLQRILRTARRMDALVLDTLAYSKLARREITLAPVPLKRLVDEVIATLDLTTGTTSITCAGCGGVVQAHEASLAQAITNLVRNALKFVAPGVAPRVNVHCEDRRDRVRLWVEDNGIGIRPELHARLFGMFERLHDERSYEGTGIGLAIVRKAIERIGGAVGVESDGTNGSRFWIELPGTLTHDEN